MDPSRPQSFAHRTARLATGRTYHFVDQAPPDGSAAPTLLCVHGFPDSWYGWRHQIAPWVRRGFRVVAPDMLGYGGTDAPADARAYTTRRLADDLAALLDLLGVQRAIVVGHDWGSYLAARFALWHPRRLCALVILSVPYVPPIPKYIPLAEIARRTPNFAYQVYFADPASTREIEGNHARFLDVMYGRWKVAELITQGGNLRAVVLGQVAGHPAARSYVTDQEIKYIAEQVRDMNGPLSYYRTTQYRFEEEKDAGLAARARMPDDLPVLFVYGTKDETATPEQLPKTRAHVPAYSEMALEGIGHWVLLQAREATTAAVLGWLEQQGLAPSVAKL